MSSSTISRESGKTPSVSLGDVTTLRDPAVMAELEQKVLAARAQEE